MIRETMTEADLAYRYQQAFHVASLWGCHPEPAAPESGAYQITLTPWSAAGKPGKPVILSGSLP